MKEETNLIFKLSQSLVDVSHGGGTCWCPHGIGHPSFSKHSEKCSRAKEALGHAGKWLYENDEDLS